MKQRDVYQTILVKYVVAVRIFTANCDRPDGRGRGRWLLEFWNFYVSLSFDNGSFSI